MNGFAGDKATWVILAKFEELPLGIAAHSLWCDGLKLLVFVVAVLGEYVAILSGDPVNHCIIFSQISLHGIGMS